MQVAEIAAFDRHFRDLRIGETQDQGRASAWIMMDIRRAMRI